MANSVSGKRNFRSPNTDHTHLDAVYWNDHGSQESTASQA